MRQNTNTQNLGVIGGLFKKYIENINMSNGRVFNDLSRGRPRQIAEKIII